MSQYLLTGAKGFVGSALALNLARKGLAFVTLPYSAKNDPGRQYERAANLFVSRGGSPIGVVIHLAARVHVMQETHADPMAAFRLANVDSTLRLASRRMASPASAARLETLMTVKSRSARAENWIALAASA